MANKYPPIDKDGKFVWSAVENSPFPLCMCAEDGEIIRISKFWEEISGYHRGEIPTIEEWINKACEEGRRGAILDKIRALFSINDGFELGEYEIKSRGGELKVWDFISTPLGRMPDGRRLALIIAKDITERKSIERARKDLLVMAMHDLKTPLTAILGYADLLYSVEENPDKSTMLHALRQGGGRLMGLLEDSLMLAKLESGIIGLNRTPNDLAELLNDLNREFLPLAKRNGISLKSEIPPLPKANFDRKLIGRSVSNLLRNAINCTPVGGEVVVKAESGMREGGRRKGGYFAISVMDTGTGIPAEESGKIFKENHRLGQAKMVKGCGLGLAIVKAVADAHGGRVMVDSQTDKGSAFHIFLPAI